MKEEKKNVICIIGMHRSGTSMVSQFLNRCGLDLGPSEQLYGPLESNPLGHFENLGFLKINDALLSHFGGTWDNPPYLREGWEYEPKLERIVNETRLLLKTFSGSSRWGWKEPRTTLLLPFWKLLIPNLKFVICVRNPLEVAKSLAQRDKMPIEKGVYLWNQYTRSAIQDTEGCPRIFTFYEDFFKDAVCEINRVVEFCDLQKPIDVSSLHDTISREFKHHTSETFEFLSEDKIITEYKLFYIGLRALSIQSSVQSVSDRNREAHISRNIDRFFQLIDEFHNQEKMTQLQTLLTEKDQQIFQLQALAQLQRQELLEMLMEKEQRVAQLQEHNQQLQAWSDKVIRSLPYRVYYNFARPVVRLFKRGK